MSMDFDREQKEAIEARNRNVLVSASAGAGKTRVLVARLIKRCVDDRVSLDRILAVTFTEAAAAEMKKRVAAELNRRYDEENDADTRQWISAQLARLVNAQITTIDSWCLTVIQKYCSVIGLDPATADNILDEGTAQALRSQAFDLALKEYDAAHHERLLQLLNVFCPRSEDYDSLQAITEKIAVHADASFDPDAWYEQAARMYHPVQRLADFEPAILDAFYGSLRLSCDHIQELLEQMSQAAAGDEEMKKPELLPAKRNLMPAVLDCLERRDYPGFQEKLLIMVQAETGTHTANTEYTAARNAMKKAAADLLENLYEEKQLVADSNDLCPLVQALLDLARSADAHYLALKKDAICMDFNDMERYAFAILSGADGEVAADVRNSLDEIMIDEFQDTSELQNAIIERIAKKDDVFRVGDVKQSIYRFRQARPALMRRLMNAGEDSEVISLMHNYRSQEPIVGFSNRLFQRLMNVSGGTDSYGEADTVSIGTDSQTQHPSRIRFVNIPGPDTEPAAEEEDSSDGEETADASASAEDTPGARRLKAEWIAAEILRLKAENPAFSYRSFAVLVRSHANKIDLKRAFDACGIPYDIDAREGFYQSDLCQNVIALIKAMNDPQDPIPLLAVLTSSFYHLNDEEIAALKIPDHSLYEGVRKQRPDILQDLQDLRAAARTDGICALLDAMAERGRFFDLLDARQKANFDFLYEKAVQFERHSSSLYGFLESMEASEDEKSGEAIDKGQDDDVVTVSTIHQSKGLQYRIVFLWSTGQNPFMDRRDPVIIDDDLKLGIRHLDLPERTVRCSVQRLAVQYKAGTEDLEEYIRLLYVALTRAEEKLYIVDSAKPARLPAQPRNITLAALSERRGISGLILSALAADPQFSIETAAPAQLPPAPAAAAAQTELPHFAGRVSVYPQKITPSSSEVTFLPDLETAGEETGRRYGTILHECIAALPNRLWTRSDLDGYGLPEADCRKILEFSTSSLYQQALKMRIEKEYPFYVLDPEKQQILTGAMDFVAFGDHEILLVDFKSDSASPAELKRRYGTQIAAYERALHLMAPDAVIHSWIYSFHNSEAVAVRE